MSFLRPTFYCKGKEARLRFSAVPIFLQLRAFIYPSDLEALKRPMTWHREGTLALVGLSTGRQRRHLFLEWLVYTRCKAASRQPFVQFWLPQRLGWDIFQSGRIYLSTIVSEKPWLYPCLYARPTNLLKRSTSAWETETHTVSGLLVHHRVSARYVTRRWQPHGPLASPWWYAVARRWRLRCFSCGHTITLFICICVLYLKK